VGSACELTATDDTPVNEVDPPDDAPAPADTYTEPPSPSLVPAVNDTPPPTCASTLPTLRLSPTDIEIAPADPPNASPVLITRDPDDPEADDPDFTNTGPDEDDDSLDDIDTPSDPPIKEALFDPKLKAPIPPEPDNPDCKITSPLDTPDPPMIDTEPPSFDAAPLDPADTRISPDAP